RIQPQRCQIREGYGSLTTWLDCRVTGRRVAGGAACRITSDIHVEQPAVCVDSITIATDDCIAWRSQDCSTGISNEKPIGRRTGKGWYGGRIVRSRVSLRD